MCVPCDTAGNVLRPCPRPTNRSSVHRDIPVSLSLSPVDVQHTIPPRSIARSKSEGLRDAQCVPWRPRRRTGNEATCQRTGFYLHLHGGSYAHAWDTRTFGRGEQGVIGERRGKCEFYAVLQLLLRSPSFSIVPHPPKRVTCCLSALFTPPPFLSRVFLRHR